MARSSHSKHTCATLTVCVMGELLVEDAVDEAAALDEVVVDEFWAETTNDPSKKESAVKRVRRQVREKVIVRSNMSTL
jgi:hypothetical protein